MVFIILILYMIKNVCKDMILKQSLQKKLGDMLKINISNNFDIIVNSTTDLEFYAYYHEKFVKSPLYKNFNNSKVSYQKALYQRKYNMIKKLVNVHNKHILDVGQEDNYYSSLFDNMVGINVDLTMNYTGDKKGIIIYDGLHIPYGDNVFDVVVIHMVLHHVIHNYFELLIDIYRVLKKGGYFIIEDHDFTDERTNNFIDIYHCLYEMVQSVEFNVDYYNHYEIRRFKKDELIMDLKKIGFKIDKIIYDKNPLKKYYLVAKK